MKTIKNLLVLAVLLTILVSINLPVNAETGYVKMGDEMLYGKPYFCPGEDVAYYIWRTPNTNIIHVRWTSDGTGRIFHGKIAADVPIMNAVSVRTESEDYIVRVSKRIITFNTATASDVDGFSFELYDPSEVRITLKVDGQLIEVSKIILGVDRAHPTGNPIVFYKP